MKLPESELKHVKKKLKELGLKDLNEYRESDTWKEVKDAYYKDHFYKCHICTTKKDLHLHHKTYKNLGDENLIRDLCYLCEDHHNSVHSYSEIRGTSLKDSLEFVLSDYISENYSSKMYEILLIDGGVIYKDDDEIYEIQNTLKEKDGGFYHEGDYYSWRAIVYCKAIHNQSVLSFIAKNSSIALVLFGPILIFGRGRYFLFLFSFDIHSHLEHHGRYLSSAGCLSLHPNILHRSFISMIFTTIHTSPISEFSVPPDPTKQFRYFPSDL